MGEPGKLRKLHRGGDAAAPNGSYGSSERRNRKDYAKKKKRRRLSRSPPRYDEKKDDDDNVDDDSNRKRLKAKYSEPLTNSREEEDEGDERGMEKEQGNGDDLSFAEPEEEMFKVEKITESKVTKNGVLYKVRWKGYGPNDDTWEPVENVATTGHADRFVRKQRQRNAGLRRGKPGVAEIEYDDGEREIVDMAKETCRSHGQDEEGQSRVGSNGGDKKRSRDYSFIRPGAKIEILWPITNVYFDCKIISWTPPDGWKSPSPKTPSSSPKTPSSSSDGGGKLAAAVTDAEALEKRRRKKALARLREKKLLEREQSSRDAAEEKASAKKKASVPSKEKNVQRAEAVGGPVGEKARAAGESKKSREVEPKAADATKKLKRRKSLGSGSDAAKAVAPAGIGRSPLAAPAPKKSSPKKAGSPRHSPLVPASAARPVSMDTERKTPESKLAGAEKRPLLKIAGAPERSPMVPAARMVSMDMESKARESKLAGAEKRSKHASTGRASQFKGTSPLDKIRAPKRSPLAAALARTETLEAENKKLESKHAVAGKVPRNKSSSSLESHGLSKSDPSERSTKSPALSKSDQSERSTKSPALSKSDPSERSTKLKVSKALKSSSGAGGETQERHLKSPKADVSSDHSGKAAKAERSNGSAEMSKSAIANDPPLSSSDRSNEEKSSVTPNTAAPPKKRPNPFGEPLDPPGEKNAVESGNPIVSAGSKTKEKDAGESVSLSFNVAGGNDAEDSSDDDSSNYDDSGDEAKESGTTSGAITKKAVLARRRRPVAWPGGKSAKESGNCIAGADTKAEDAGESVVLSLNIAGGIHDEDSSDDDISNYDDSGDETKASATTSGAIQQKPVLARRKRPVAWPGGTNAKESVNSNASAASDAKEAGESVSLSFNVAGGIHDEDSSDDGRSDEDSVDEDSSEEYNKLESGIKYNVESDYDSSDDELDVAHSKIVNRINGVGQPKTGDLRWDSTLERMKGILGNRDNDSQQSE